MTVLVTGGAGYIGSHMVLALVDAGEKVVVIDRLSAGVRSAFVASAENHVADIADIGLLEQIITTRNIRSILHFAGSTDVGESVRNPGEYYRNNTVNSLSLMEIAARLGVESFVFSSTAAVYGTTGREVVDETVPTAPESPYGRSKLMAETMLADIAAASGLKYGVLRYFNVAGADPALRAGHHHAGAPNLLKLACQAAIGNRSHIDVFGTDYPTRDGTCIRDYVHVSDLIDAHMLCLERLRSGGASGTYNCGYGKGYSVLEVLHAAQRVGGRPFDIRYAARRDGDPVAVVADASLARRELGWVPKYDDLDTIIGHQLAWERKAFPSRL